MGIVHHTATMSPTKQELVESWLPTRSWAQDRHVTGKVAEYRFDDPAGEVGVETILWLTEDGTVLQTPLTYRAEPLAGAEDHLVGTTDHSVLGERWVYDGCGDPVWATALATAIATGGRQAQMFIEQDGQRVDVPPRMQVRGSGEDDSAPEVRAVDAVTRAGFDVERATYIFAGTFPVFAADRIRRRVTERGARAVVPSPDSVASLPEVSPLAERVLAGLSSIDRRLLARGDLPFGSSVVIAAAKPGRQEPDDEGDAHEV